MIVLLDMDGVIADYDTSMHKQLLLVDSTLTPQNMWAKVNACPQLQLIKNRIQASDDFYKHLEPMPHAIEATKEMMSKYDVRFCSTPDLLGRTCHSNKHEWIATHFGQECAQKLILTCDKTLIRGDVLIDDNEGITGSVVPEWTQIICGTPYSKDPLRQRLRGNELRCNDIKGALTALNEMEKKYFV